LKKHLKRQHDTKKNIFLIQDDHELVAETAVVGFPHDIKGEGVYAYIVLKEFKSQMTKEEQQKVADDLRAIVKLKISGFAVPDLIQVLKFNHFICH
jgi:acetyl-CoA synthetase